MTKTYYITTPIYYVNGKPHIGHAYTSILCDTFSRYKKFCGEESFFLTGTDEHGIKVQKTAVAAGKEPKEFVDEIVPQFKELWRILGIEYDHFIRTTDEHHKEAVQKILKGLETKGDIYKASYKGWYCTPCESFWTGLQLKDGKCPDCNRAVEELEEENYFFKLSKYQDWLIEYINDNPQFIRPDYRKNEILGFLKEPLQDLCITRPKSRLTWGIEYPGTKDHVVYVWFDALVNYLSATGYPQDLERSKTLWPADMHLIGKDIIRQHAIFWPIMLHSMNVELPKLVLAHGWWRIGGEKMSKSLGNIVEPVEIAHKYGSDVLRYYLLNEVTLGMDGSYSEGLLRERYSSDLANSLGNLWHRAASMIEKYFSGVVPSVSSDVLSRPLAKDTFALWKNVYDFMAVYNVRDSLAAIWSVVTRANQFVEETKPWALAKDSSKRQELADVLYLLVESVAHIGVLLQAFLPDTAKKIMERLKIEKIEMIESAVRFSSPFIKAGATLEKGEPLFPRLDEPEQ